jgi:hypothetical protein
VLERAVGSQTYRSEVRTANAELYHRLGRLIDASGSIQAAPLDERFTFAGFGQTTRAIIDSFEASGGATDLPGHDIGHIDVQANLIREFARLEYFRLLYE